jgi:hypothetical protein
MAYINFDPQDYFNTKLYTGNATGRTISGVGFQPDWTWIKNRSDTSGHRVLDVVRGGTKELIANGTNAEITEAQSLQSWNSDGFVLGTAAGVNANTNNFVSWNWLANGAGVSNTDGDITSTVSASTTSGFSIVKWTGTGSDGTIGHGLGVAPKMVIVKSLANTTYWMVYNANLGNAQEIFLNTTNASGASSAWNSTTPTSSVISLDGEPGNGVNASGDYIAYCFVEKKGFSKFGSYTGNGSTDGTFIYTGMKPAYVLTKRTDASENWVIQDNKQSPFNPTYDFLLADSDGVPTAGGTPIDLLSNGFKVRTTSAYSNASGGTYIYMAFAEQPLINSLGNPATAR